MKKLVLNIVKLCSDEESRSTGLMKFRLLNDDECAFFIFPSSRAHCFWNKNVNYDLSLACINDRFKISCFMELKKQSENPIYPEKRDIKYVIEANRGLFEKHGVTVGDFIDFDPSEEQLIIKSDDQILSLYDYMKK